MTATVTFAAVRLASPALADPRACGYVGRGQRGVREVVVDEGSRGRAVRHRQPDLVAGGQYRQQLEDGPLDGHRRAADRHGLRHREMF
jgi:hypothetical protein